MGFKDEQEHYRLMLGQTPVVLVAERGSKRLGLYQQPQFCVELVALDKALYVYELRDKVQEHSTTRNIHAQLNVDPTGCLTLRTTPYAESRIEKLSDEERNAIGRFKF